MQTQANALLTRGDFHLSSLTQAAIASCTICQRRNRVAFIGATSQRDLLKLCGSCFERFQQWCAVQRRTERQVAR